MGDGTGKTLAGKRVLLVEDDYMIATGYAFILGGAGVDVIGPVSCVADALTLINNEGDHLDGALLDVNLNGEQVFPVADCLAAHHVPWVFVTGYDENVIPSAYSDAPRLQKPIDGAQLFRALQVR